jgi:dephospho-CoA kinase
MVVIGLTGGIAAGKSTIAQELARLGAAVIDADKVGHEVYAPGTEGWRLVREAFGERVVAPDGTIDRRALGAIVFADPAQRDRLQAIVWPLIKRMIAERIAELRRANAAPAAVVEAAVLLEARWEDLMDQVWVVIVPPEVAIARLVARNGLTPEQARARLAAQLSNEERARRADVVIDNARPLDETLAQVRQLWQQLAVAGNAERAS